MADIDPETLIAEGLQLHRQKKYDDALAIFDQVLAVDGNNERALQEKVRLLRAQRNFDRANLVLNEALVKLPDSVWLLNERGWWHSNQRFYDDAIASFDETLVRDRVNEEALLAKAQILRTQRRLTEAQKSLDDALARLPECLILIVEQGWLYFLQRLHEKALAVFDRAVAIDGAHVGALFAKARTLRFLHRYDDLDAFIGDALLRVPGNATLLNEHGWSYSDRHRYDEALAAFDQTLAAEANNEDALVGKSSIYRVRSQFADRDRLLTDALVSLPRSVALLNERGRWCYDQSLYEDAVGWFDRSLAVAADNEETLRSKAVTLRVMQKFDDAGRVLDDAIQRFPNNVSLLNERGWWFTSQRLYEEARAPFDRSLEIDAADESALQGKTRLLRILSRWDEADRALTDALEQRPDSVILHNERGWWYYDRRLYSEAVNEFDRALALDEDDEDALLWKARAFRVARRFEQAAQAVSDGLQRSPKRALFLIEQGWLHYAQHRCAEAVMRFDEALAADPDNEDAVQGKVRALRAKRELGAADTFLSDLLSRKPANVSFLKERGWLYYDQDDPQHADECFKKAADINRFHIDAQLARIDALIRLHRSDEAKQILRRLLDAEPANLEVRSQFGWFHLRNNDAFSAKKEFEAIAARDNASVLAINGLGAVAFDSQDYDEAQANYIRALEIDPNEPAYHANLAWAIVRRIQVTPRVEERPLFRFRHLKVVRLQPEPPDAFAEAEEHCRTALELDPNFSSAFECLGIIAFKQRRLRDAEDLFLESIRANPRTGSYQALGSLYVAVGRYDEGKQQLEAALRRKPNDPAALLELGNLSLQLDDAAQAIRYFKEAMECDPRNEEPPRALSIALRRRGDFAESEQVLRKAIRELEGSRCGPLHLTLATLLTQLGDDTGDESYYGDALTEVNKAIALSPREADAYFDAGVIRHKLDDLPKAMKYFRRCLELDPNRFDAERNLRIVQSVVKKQRKKAQGLTATGLVLGSISFLMLGVLWWGYFGAWATTKVSVPMMFTFTPLLLGLTFVGLLAPWLLKFKLPGGLEAELSQPTETVSKGPTGSIGFRTPSISVGPR
jgi:tetratricopeptide (TPR) repeat protein